MKHRFIAEYFLQQSTALSCASTWIRWGAVLPIWVTGTGHPFPNSSIEVPGNKKSRLQLETPPMHKSLANFLLPKLHWKSPAVAEVPQIPWGQRDIALKCWRMRKCFPGNPVLTNCIGKGGEHHGNLNLRDQGTTWSSKQSNNTEMQFLDTSSWTSRHGSLRMKSGTEPRSQ